MNITKGKWCAVENDYYIDIKVDGNSIAQVTTNEFIGTDKDAMRANARLMECAPDMYDFLEGIVDGALDESANNELRALLAKARG
ncbi:hypothetical protein PP586_gp58 [Pseudoalteromonas phage vB_PspS-H40/1]|uniref:hypothetical protein n=1 Tax=Pseudoalteromonas phage vB_PspS-H40/1 TaxID=1856120 RepID=UPI0007DCD1EE|nr:hypothetical protein PP586_gp58 [Pseudoalteromonas phage vB_PspS-H40/1]ANI22075.1 hypothetical protein H401_58 [Pseudoalteromonas phage vB_PspS-H40/1]